MTEVAYMIGAGAAAACAFSRVAGFMVAALRSLRRWRQFEVFRFGWAEALVGPEVPLLGAATVALVAGSDPSTTSVARAVAALGGALLAVGGIAVILWTLLSWRTLFVGHGVLPEQELITGGAYGFVRHPVYLGGLMIWSGLSLSFLSVPAAALTAGYVIPAYLLYIRSEESMMLDSFGNRYRRYRVQVPRLLPKSPSENPRVRLACAGPSGARRQGGRIAALFGRLRTPHRAVSAAAKRARGFSDGL